MNRRKAEIFLTRKFKKLNIWPIGRKEIEMTICELRKIYPLHDFYFFKDGYELRKSPFYHAKIKSFEIVNVDTIFVYM